MCQLGIKGDGLSLAELHPLIVPQYAQVMEQEVLMLVLVGLCCPLPEGPQHSL